MTQINNPEVMKKLIEEAQIQTSADAVPNQLAEKIIPVLNVNPNRLVKIGIRTLNDAASGAIHTTSTTRDTYLLGAYLSVAKDVNSDSVSSAINATAFGEASSSILILRYEPTTAGQLSKEIMFNGFPIKLERGTPINSTNAAATASIDSTALIFYYEVEDAK